MGHLSESFSWIHPSFPASGGIAEGKRKIMSGFGILFSVATESGFLRLSLRGPEGELGRSAPAPFPWSRTQGSRTTGSSMKEGYAAVRWTQSWGVPTVGIL